MKSHTINYEDFLRQPFKKDSFPFSWRIQPYGYLEAVELILDRPELIVNASEFYQLNARIMVNGKAVDFSRGYSLHRGVEFR